MSNFEHYIQFIIIEIYVLAHRFTYCAAPARDAFGNIIYSLANSLIPIQFLYDKIKPFGIFQNNTT